MIIIPDKFIALIGQAQADLLRLLRSYPDHAALQSAQRQLASLAEWTRDGRWPTPAQRKQLSIGLIAAREIEPLDLPLAQQIYALMEFLPTEGP